MKLQSQVVSGSEEFRANVKGHMEALDIVRDAAEAATAGGGATFTRHTPNTSAHDIVVGWNDDWCAPGSSQPENNRPCVRGSANYLDNTSAARSMHVGGVFALLVDNSVHFVSENVDLGTWQRLAAMMDGEMVGEY